MWGVAVVVVVVFVGVLVVVVVVERICLFGLCMSNAQQIYLYFCCFFFKLSLFCNTLV